MEDILTGGTIAPGNSSIRLVNKTGYIVHYAYVSPANSNSWGTDRLGANVLNDGQAITISSLHLNERYDIRLVDSDGDSYTKNNLQLSANQSVEFTISDLDRRNDTSTSAPPAQND